MLDIKRVEFLLNQYHKYQKIKLTFATASAILIISKTNQKIAEGVESMQLDENEIRQIVRNLCMMNNKFMNRMLDDNIEAAEIMLRVMMKDDTIKVIDVGIQSFIQNLYGHSAQLDILAQDGLGRYFNVEVQRSDESAPVRRARYYSSVLDTKFLQPGVDYDELPDSYVIFITENDVLKKELPLYHVDRTIAEDGTKFGDGSHIMYVNSKIQDDTPLGRLMQDMYCTDPTKLHYKEFAKRMKYLKYNKEGEEKMTDIIEDCFMNFYLYPLEPSKP